jgi:hypothetical protein
MNSRILNNNTYTKDWCGNNQRDKYTAKVSS